MKNIISILIIFCLSFTLLFAESSWRLGPWLGKSGVTEIHCRHPLVVAKSTENYFGISTDNINSISLGGVSGIITTLNIYENNILIGTMGSGVFLYRIYSLRTNIGLLNKNISAIYSYQNYIFIGTAGNSIDSAGIYRSTDVGVNWKYIKIDFDTSNTSGQIIPNSFYYDDEILYLCSENGLYKSIDDGLNWESITSSAVDFNIETPKKIITTDDEDRVLLTDKVYILQKKESFDNLKRIFVAIDFPVNDVVTFNNKIIVCTTDTINSILLSIDKGESYTIETSGLGNYKILCLAVDSLGWMYAGAEKYSMFRNTGLLTEIEDYEKQLFSCNASPNPFSESTTINFNLEANCEVRLSVFNFLGQEVAILLNHFLSAGQHSAKFDGTNLPNGTYFYKLQVGSEVRTGKVLLIDN